jgi:hypothetical protein
MQVSKLLGNDGTWVLTERTKAGERRIMGRVGVTHTEGHVST